MNKPMRILQVGMSPNYGGTESFIMSIYRNIDREKIQFDFLNVYDTPIAFEEEIKRLGGRIFKLKLQRRDGYKKYKEGIKHFYNEYGHEFKGVHCHVQSSINVDMIVYAKKYHIPLRIIHGHNTGTTSKLDLLASLMVVLGKKKARKYATAFFACSKEAANYVFGKRTAKKAIVVNNGIVCKDFVFNENFRKEIREKYNIEDNQKLYGNIGRMDKQKNQLFLLDVFKIISQKDPLSVLMIVGSGEWRELIEKKISDLGLKNAVILTGQLKEYINKYYCAMDEFLFPSNFEGLGIVLIEAQASGLPCVSSKYVIPESATVCKDICISVSLNESKEKWAEIAVDYVNKKVNREEYAMKVKEAKYDAKDTASFVFNFYMSFLSKDVENE